MKKALLIIPLLLLVSCGGDRVFTPDHIGQINDNADRIGQLEDRVSSLETNVSVLDNSLTSLTSIVSIAVIDIDLLESALEEEVEDREDADDILRGKIRKANRKRRQLSNRFDRFRRYQSSVNRRVDRAIQGLERTDDFQFFLMYSGFHYLDNKINRVNSSISDRIDNLSISDIDGLDSTLGDLQNDLGELELALEEEIEDREDADDILRGKIRRIKNRASNLKEEVEGLGEDILDINDLIDGIDLALLALDSRIDNLPAPVDGVDGVSCSIEQRNLRNHRNHQHVDIVLVCGQDEHVLANNRRI